MRNKLLIALAPALVAVLLAPMATAASADAAADFGPVEVGTDAQGDWGGGGDAALVGHAAGQDLIGASIEMRDDIVYFVMKLTYLPSVGGVPEVSRYTWDFLVDNTPGVDNEDGTSDAKFFELDGKFTNYSRGICDPTSGKCPPPRDPGERPFFLRSTCETQPVGVTNLTVCQELANIKATFNPVARTITVPVPVSILGGLPPCGGILAGRNIFGGSISAAPAAYVTSSAMPMDTMDLEGVFQLPTDDEDKPCPDLVSDEV